MFSTIILIIFSGLMLWAAYSDISRYILSNRLCLVTFFLYPLYLCALYLAGHGLPLNDILWAGAFSLIIFLICAGLFAGGMMGGGDVKLIPAVALWAGPDHILPYLFITSLTGGLIATIIVIKNRIKMSKYYKSSANVNFSEAKMEKNQVPYGVGIALGGLYVAWKLLMANI